MLVYKVTFLNNKIISCGLVNPSKHKDLKADVFVSQSNGLLIFALIKANSKMQALEKAESLIKDLAKGNGRLLTQEGDTTDKLSFNGVPDSSDVTVSTGDYIDTTFLQKTYGSSADLLDPDQSRNGPQPG